MLLTITTTPRPATDLGFLLHKHPDRFQSYDLSIGRAHAYNPEAGDDEAIRRIFAADIGRDRLGGWARREGGRFRFAFPIVALTGRKPL